MKKHYRHENDCLNCGSELQGKYCHNCGQENLQIKENFGHLMNHAISDYFHFDHQFFHTLKPLLFKPGKLTNEYMAGKRVQYLHPIKMYIFISLVFFVLIFRENKEEKVEFHQKKARREVTDSVARRINKNPKLTDSQKKAIKDIAIGGLNIKADTSDTAGKHGLVSLRMDEDKADSTYDAYMEHQRNLPSSQRDGFFTRLMMKQYKLNNGEGFKTFKEELEHNAPKIMFVLLPLFALILRVSFWKNKKYYVEHLMFSFHLHCFIFLFLAAIMLIKLIPGAEHISGWLGFASFICITLYIYKALRAVYHRSRWRTISKMIGMSFVYYTVGVVCFVAYAILIASLN